MRSHQAMHSHSTPTDPLSNSPGLQPSLAQTQRPHLGGASTSTQVVAELPSEAPAEAGGKLGVQCQALMQPGQLSVAVDCFALSRILHLLKMCQKFFFLIPEECTIGASFHQMTDTFGWFLICGNCE